MMKIEAFIDAASVSATRVVSDRPEWMSMMKSITATSTMAASLRPVPTFLLASSSSVSSMMDSTTTTTTDPALVFEPVVNIPALSAFLVILVMFLFLQSRIMAITEAAERGSVTLAELREIKSRELSTDGTDRPSPEAVQAAVEAYREALTDEERQRTVVPGVRIPTPVSSIRTAQDRAAVQRFLGITVEEPNNLSQVMADEARQQEQLNKKGLPPLAVGLLVTVALTQVMLLGLLSFDRDSM